ncbi:ionotropic receptor 21a-like [Penaeus japonicus]|uniref:ionotropic receptor 21a-like n=1 Tax=Penaeus japonicus TaxID=27405 RepID=UPI001C70E015|nr:ionotropic receptor 21a-like [Penaeus japonicus]
MHLLHLLAMASTLLLASPSPSSSSSSTSFFSFMDTLSVSTPSLTPPPTPVGEREKPDDPAFSIVSPRQLEAKRAAEYTTIIDEFKTKEFHEEVADLLLAVSASLQQCALAITADEASLPSVDLFLKRSQLSPVTIFTLSADDIGNRAPYSMVGQETCTHYIFLVKSAKALLRLLESIFEEDLNLLANFVLITELQKEEVLDFLQASPISKIVNILLVLRSSGAEEVKLHLYTHDFFLNNQRISSKFLGVWSKGLSSSKSKDFEWFPGKLNDFYGFKFRATTFNHPPVSIFEPLTSGTYRYDGLEVRLLMTLASALNFTVEISMPRDGEKWGAKLPNGSWTGAVGETVRGETDVSFANYFITADRLKIMDMTRPYYIDYTCFITPMPQPLPQYTAVAWPLQTWVWAALAMTLVAVPLVVRLAAVVEPRAWFSSLNNAYWYVVGIFLTRSQPVQLVPSTWGLRLVILTSWIAATIISAGYKSSVIAFLLVPLPAQPVNTLEQLLRSSLRWGVRDRGGWGEWFSNSLDPTSRKIAEGFEFVNGIDSGIGRVLEGDFAFMNSGTFLRYLIASNFTNAYGQTELHIAKECFVPFRIGLGMPRFSVYTERFNKVVGQVVEAGMVSRWFQDLLAKAEQKQRGKIQGRQREEEGQGSSSTPTKTLGIYHLQGTFALLGLGWLLAGVTFLVESAMSRSCRSENHRQQTGVMKSQTKLNFE